jgi:hypothetical protein
MQEYISAGYVPTEVNVTFSTGTFPGVSHFQVKDQFDNGDYLVEARDRENGPNLYLARKDKFEEFDWLENYVDPNSNSKIIGGKYKITSENKAIVSLYSGLSGPNSNLAVYGKNVNYTQGDVVSFEEYSRLMVESTTPDGFKSFSIYDLIPNARAIQDVRGTYVSSTNNYRIFTGATKDSGTGRTLVKDSTNNFDGLYIDFEWRLLAENQFQYLYKELLICEPGTTNWRKETETELNTWTQSLTEFKINLDESLTLRDENDPQAVIFFPDPRGDVATRSEGDTCAGFGT